MEQLLETLSENTHDFWVEHEVRVLENPTVEEFLREACCSYHPVILRGIMDDWQALNKWNLEYLEAALNPNTVINVNLTPDGLGDCVKEKVFYYPCECNMSIHLFCEMMRNRNENDAVPYYSQQNDNFREVFSALHQDVQLTLPLANKAFGVTEPEAVNLWIGDERSVSSMHKDHFENMYAVVSGEKTFTLLPPTDIAYLHEAEYPTARYALRPPHSSEPGDVISQRITKEDLMVLERGEGCPSATLPWIALDPDDDDFDTLLTTYPSFAKTKPLRCVVRPGEILYIPSMWYHRVSQTSLTIAVNYWYEQKFNFRYVMYQMVRSAIDNKMNSSKSK